MRTLRLGFVLGLACLATADTPAAEPAPSSLVGKWAGKDDKGEEGAFIFGADGSVDVIKDGVSLNETMLQGQGSASYRFDPSVKPFELDIVVSKQDRPTLTLRCIVEFFSPDRMRVRISPGGPRPRDFDGPKADMIVVERARVENKKP